MPTRRKNATVLAVSPPTTASQWCGAAEDSEGQSESAAPGEAEGDGDGEEPQSEAAAPGAAADAGDFTMHLNSASEERLSDSAAPGAAEDDGDVEMRLGSAIEEWQYEQGAPRAAEDDGDVEMRRQYEQEEDSPQIAQLQGQLQEAERKLHATITERDLLKSKFSTYMSNTDEQLRLAHDHLLNGEKNPHVYASTWASPTWKTPDVFFLIFSGPSIIFLGKEIHTDLRSIDFKFKVASLLSLGDEFKVRAEANAVHACILVIDRT
jgi:hypothetical protein